MNTVTEQDGHVWGAVIKGTGYPIMLSRFLESLYPLDVNCHNKDVAVDNFDDTAGCNLLPINDNESGSAPIFIKTKESSHT